MLDNKRYLVEGNSLLGSTFEQLFDKREDAEKRFYELHDENDWMSLSVYEVPDSYVTEITEELMTTVKLENEINPMFH